ncbi:MAG: transporter substrate-binding domain-containing protein, partial [Micromonosporaceae bacterium]
SKPSPGTRAWAVLRRLRAGGWLRPRRIGCLLVVLVILLITALWVLGSAVNGITAMFRNDPDPVAGSPFDTVTTSPPSSGPTADLINGGKLIVAVPPGFGAGGRTPGSGDYAGFDLALLDLVAHDLGAASVDTGKQTSEKTRLGMLTRGEADLGLFEITPQRHSGVDIVGPYLLSELRLAVPSTSPVTGVDSLGDGDVCAPRDSPAATALADRLGQRLKTRASLNACVSLLGEGVTAIAADDVALRALPEQANGELRMVGDPLGSTQYGIGVSAGDAVLRERITAVLRKAVADGTWALLYEQYLGAPAPTPPTIR